VFDFFGVALLLLLTVLGIWLARRSRRAEPPVVKWTGVVLSSLVALIGSVAVVLTVIGFYRINVPSTRGAVPQIKVAGTPEQIARGARFGTFCGQCHSPNGQPPFVGSNFAAEGPPVGTLWAPNLTPAGEIGHWSDGEVIRAIREGIHQSGRALIIMPSEVFRYLSDADVEGIVAYLRSQAPAEPNNPPAHLNVLAALLLGAGVVSTSAQPPIPHAVAAPAEAISTEHGRYLVSILGCRLCHGENLTGGKIGGPGPPGGPNLTPFLAKWSADEFVQTLRTGVDPNKHTLAPGMPWKSFSAFASDTDLRAMYLYLHELATAKGPPD
jgi:mono/diheme cytochrome c family protein